MKKIKMTTIKLGRVSKVQRNIAIYLYIDRTKIRQTSSTKKYEPETYFVIDKVSSNGLYFNLV